MENLCAHISTVLETSFGVILSPELIRLALVFTAAQVVVLLFILISASQKQIFTMKKFINDLLRDKDGAFNLREISSFIFLLLIVFSWAAETLLGLSVPHYLVYLFFGGLGIGGVGYSIERKSDRTKEQTGK